MAKLLPRRLASIDIFRALTMFFMIFVNDLWSLKGIPGWLEHAAKNEDALGFADTIFPTFLFIVGLSIPFAILARQSKAASTSNVLTYIGTRSLALLVMGIFHVNLESYNKTDALLPKPIWQILITIGFFLIWLDYAPTMKKARKWVFQTAGVMLLVLMAIFYKGGDAGNPVWMKTHWYGILGLIGWSYLLCAGIFLFSKERLSILVGALLFFLLFNIGVNADWLEFLQPVKRYIWIVGDGALPALTMAGVVIAVLYRKLVNQGKDTQYWLICTGMAAIMLVSGFALRPYWGISKIKATPSWVMICTAIGIVVFLLLILLADIKNKQHWFAIIKPAGTSTLTAYLLPYIHYAIFNIFGKAYALPLVLRTGITGIVKCLLYALLIILITGLLENKRIRLKI